MTGFRLILAKILAQQLLLSLSQNDFFIVLNVSTISRIHSNSWGGGGGGGGLNFKHAWKRLNWFGKSVLKPHYIHAIYNLYWSTVINFGAEKCKINDVQSCAETIEFFKENVHLKRGR